MGSRPGSSTLGSDATPNVTLTVHAHLFRWSDDKAAQMINAALAGLGAS
jgi:hypothetical protein